jgi:hypothetical protein
VSLWDFFALGLKSLDTYTKIGLRGAAGVNQAIRVRISARNIPLAQKFLDRCLEDPRP